MLVYMVQKYYEKLHQIPQQMVEIRGHGGITTALPFDV